ncbi:MAG TPA: 50S ribosomal protein L11 methyltransferase [Burkholderiales bacterium]|nr:50S ribosomal protein L11 methyltransferase [Burkholderiales bacterium]
MAWLAIQFVAPGERVDELSDELLASGAVCVDTADSAADTEAETPIFEEPGATLAPWPAARVTALFPEDLPAQTLVRQVLAACGIGETIELQARRVDDADWVRLTQDQFLPIRISNRLWIVPTWHTSPDPTAINVVLDPGIAFGTGSHPTTRLCLEWLADTVHGGERVLDYGCGSGILAIAAMKLGAAVVHGVDIDPQAVLAAVGNAEQNRVAAHFTGPDAAPVAVYDIVLANILSNPLKALAPLLTSRVRPGGWLLLSGILQAQAADVVASYAPALHLAPVAVLDGWALLAGRRS